MNGFLINRNQKFQHRKTCFLYSRVCCNTSATLTSIISEALHLLHEGTRRHSQTDRRKRAELLQVKKLSPSFSVFSLIVGTRVSEYSMVRKVRYSIVEYRIIEPWSDIRSSNWFDRSSIAIFDKGFDIRYSMVRRIEYLKDSKRFDIR